MGWHGYGYGYGWAPYVPVAQRRRQAAQKMNALRKKGVDVQPVAIDGRKIAKSFWGEAWCEHLESFSDFENRLPRGRTYVRNGSVCHLAVAKGRIEAKVSGSKLYDVKVSIKTLPGTRWSAIRGRCSGQIGSLLELLQGRLSDHAMAVVTDRQDGLFPSPKEISFTCSCPDWAVMCKHVAAVLYGVGARLDAKPELLFLLRGVNHDELIEADAEAAMAGVVTRGKSKRLAAGVLSDVFGIELETGDAGATAAGTSQDQASETPVSTKAPRRGPAVAKRVAEKNGSARTAPKRGRKKAAVTPKKRVAAKRKATPAAA
ncbi:MAG: hypothetical protein ABR915_08090 [Thermoguttaceae bacterium]|jgi:uncharacterized Zn finger protein